MRPAGCENSFIMVNAPLFEVRKLPDRREREAGNTAARIHTRLNSFEFCSNETPKITWNFATYSTRLILKSPQYN